MGSNVEQFLPVLELKIRTRRWSLSKVKHPFQWGRVQGDFYFLLDDEFMFNPHPQQEQELIFDFLRRLSQGKASRQNACR